MKCNKCTNDLACTKNDIFSTCPHCNETLPISKVVKQIVQKYGEGILIGTTDVCFSSVLADAMKGEQKKHQDTIRHAIDVQKIPHKLQALKNLYSQDRERGVREVIENIKNKFSKSEEDACMIVDFFVGIILGHDEAKNNASVCTQIDDDTATAPVTISAICPVCKKSAKTKCSRCGFEIPTINFESKNDANNWYKKEVLPYREDWLKKDHNGAIEYYDESIQQDSKNTASYISRGNAYWHKGEYNIAITNYTQAISINKKYITAYNNRGLTYLKKKDFDQAILDFDQMIQIEPKNVSAYYNCGVAYYNKKDYATAIENWNKTLRIAPNHSRAKENIKKAQQALQPTPATMPVHTEQLVDTDDVNLIKQKYIEKDFSVWYNKINEDYNKSRWFGYTLHTDLSRKDFIFTFGYNDQKAVVDKNSKKKYGGLSTSDLANKGLFRAAVSSAIYSENQLELIEVADIYNKISGTKHQPDDLPRLFGVPKQIVKSSKKRSEAIYI